ncbi:hypothetical protein ABEB36_014661 [Hypothenemus hampei]|uniref:Uncharacterized protein n=1 Tax=Hypothenemus hampei TaxID=57062 RepID=A0ABD1E3B4_HYPHA
MEDCSKSEILKLKKVILQHFNHFKIQIGSGVIAILMLLAIKSNPETVSLDKKGSRQSIGRPCRRKRRYPLNRYSMEKVEANTISASFGYRLINFVSIFSAIGEIVQCKKCGGDVTFTETSLRGLGFKLKVKCAKCEIQQLQFTIGPNALRLSEDLDARRISIANLRAQQDTKEARMLRRAAQKESQDMATSLEGLLYGPGIAD